MLENATLQTNVLPRTIKVETDGDNLVINTTTTRTLSKAATRQELSRLHRETLVAYVQSLVLDLPFDTFETRGDLIDAILAAREEAE